MISQRRPVGFCGRGREVSTSLPRGTLANLGGYVGIEECSTKFPIKVNDKVPGSGGCGRVETRGSSKSAELFEQAFFEVFKILDGFVELGGAGITN